MTEPLRTHSGGIENRVSALEVWRRGMEAKFTVANVPDATKFEGREIYVSNGAAGSPVRAFSNGTNWLRCDTLAAISA